MRGAKRTSSFAILGSWGALARIANVLGLAQGLENNLQ